jgi:site-specific recombinase XerD
MTIHEMTALVLHGTLLPVSSERTMQVLAFPARSLSAPRSAPAHMLTADDAVARFLTHRRPRVTRSTLNGYRDRLIIWQTWRERHGHTPFVCGIQIEEFRAFMAYLTDEHTPYQDHPYRRVPPNTRMAPSSIDGIYRALQIFWNFLADEEDVLSDAQARFFQGRRIARVFVPENPRPVYGESMLEALLAACDRSRNQEEAARNAAMLCMLYESGARIAEVCSLQDDHVELGERTALTLGKGRKYRYLFWTVRTAAALDAYLALRRGEWGGSAPLFRSCGNDPAITAIQADSFRSAAQRIADRAGVRLADGAPVHAFRHAYARRFLEEGGEGLHLQQLLGHASMQTTERYVRESPKRLRQIYRRIFGE